MSGGRPGPALVTCCARRTARPGESLCAACAPTLCGLCRGLHGHHAPSCRAGLCHGCGERTALGDKFYCPACRARRCPECGRFAGQHGPSCRYEHRDRAPVRMVERPRYGVVSADDVEAVYRACWEEAVRLAGFVYAPIGARDLVQDVAEWCLTYREHFDRPLTREYFLAAVRSRARREWRYGRVLFERPMDPDDLLAAEERREAERRGRPHDDAVRLPDVDALTPPSDPVPK